MKPLILLSNDDGIDSPYILALADTLGDRLSAEVLVIAPERQRSAMSHTITLHKPLRVQEVGPGRFWASGSPVDCVYLGIMRMCERKPDLVVSGINDGYNLGTDVFYSGTVGAALEGGLRGCPAMAVSLAHGQSAFVGKAVDFAVLLAERLLAEPPERPTVFNVNVPPGDDRTYELTRLGKRHYRDDVEVRQDPRGRSYYWIGGGEAGMDDLVGSDCQAIAAGAISVTPMHLDLTAHELLGDGAPSWQLRGFERRV